MVWIEALVFFVFGFETYLGFCLKKKFCFWFWTFDPLRVLRNFGEHDKSIDSGW